MTGLETLNKYQMATLNNVSLVQTSKDLIIAFCTCMVNSSKNLKGCYNLQF